MERRREFYTGYEQSQVYAVVVGEGTMGVYLAEVVKDASGILTQGTGFRKVLKDGSVGFQVYYAMD